MPATRHEPARQIKIPCPDVRDKGRAGSTGCLRPASARKTSHECAFPLSREGVRRFLGAGNLALRPRRSFTCERSGFHCLTGAPGSRTHYSCGTAPDFDRLPPLAGSTRARVRWSQHPECRRPVAAATSICGCKPCGQECSTPISCAAVSTRSATPLHGTSRPGTSVGPMLRGRAPQARLQAFRLEVRPMLCGRAPRQ